MLTIGSLSNEDVKRLQPVFQACYDVFQSVDGIYYKVIIEGQEYILHRLADVFTLLRLEEDNIVNIEMFTVDENYQISAVAFEDYEMQVVDGKRVFQKRGGVINEFLDCFKREGEPDDEGYYGVVRYVQYNSQKDLRVYLWYQQNVEDENSRIYPYHLVEPFVIKIEKFGNLGGKKFVLPFSKQTFVKRTFDYRDEPLYYTLATMKDCGMAAVIGNNVVSLNETMAITRYYRELFLTSNYYAFTGFPFCPQYKLEEIYAKLRSMGFSLQVPKILIDEHNDDIPEVKIYKELAMYMKDFETSKEFIDGKPEVLKYRMNGENIDDGDN